MGWWPWRHVRPQIKRANLAFLPWGMSLSLMACASNAINVPPLKAAPPKASPAEEARIFRELMYAQCQDSMKREDFLRTVLLPDANLFAADQSSFAAISAHVSKRRPEEFLRMSYALPLRGRVKPPPPPPPPVPLTFVVVPGLSHEAASRPLFADVVEKQNSSFARTVREKFAKASPQQRLDERYSLADLAVIKVALSDMVQAASIDDDNGRPIVQLVYLHSVLGSLESYGRIDSLYPIYKRRLDKFFAVVGSQPRLYFMGHSRGAAISVDMLARLAEDRDAQPWSKNIEGFVGLNGALFGSHYANAFYTPGKYPYRVFYKNFMKVSQLDESSGVIDSIITRHQMSTSLIAMAKGAALDPYLRRESWSLPALPLSGIKQAKEFELQLRPHASYFGDYPQFIRRVKTLVGAAEVAIRDLTHAARLKWWSTHTLPTHLRYLTMTSTQASPVFSTRLSPWQAALLDAPGAGRHLIDYPVMRGFYNAYYDDQGASINDGLVGVHEGSMWPTLHQKLNPKQSAYRSTNLALFAAHHMPLAYDHAVGDEADKAYRFPRVKMLLALAEYLALIDRREPAPAAALLGGHHEPKTNPQSGRPPEAKSH